jgi:hypothetical protein
MGNIARNFHDDKNLARDIWCPETNTLIFNQHLKAAAAPSFEAGSKSPHPHENLLS